MSAAKDLQRSPVNLTRGRHVAGVALLLLAISSVAMVPYLPSRGSNGLDLPFLRDATSPVVAAFAGYPACGTTCPTSLALLAQAHRELQDEGGRPVDLLFINVHRGTPVAVADRYAKSFHPDFRSHTVDDDAAGEIYSALSLRSFDDAGLAASHSSSIYVFVRGTAGWRIEHVFQRTPRPGQLLNRLRAIAISA